MKRKLIASVVGIVAVLATSVASYGQGTVFFSNYVTPGSAPGDPGVNAPITRGDNGMALGSSFYADLLYSLDGSTWNMVAGSKTAFLGASDGDTANGAGYFVGNSVTIPGYTAGSISFIVQAYLGNSYETSAIRGQSAAFSLPSIATGSNPVGSLYNLQSFVVPVPEPSAFALAGLGSMAILLLRRRK